MTTTVIDNKGVSSYNVTDTGVTINQPLSVSGDVTFTGDAIFSGSVTGLSVAAATSNVAETDDPSLNSPETYDCVNNTRAFRLTAAPGGNWTIAALTNTGLSASQATSVKILFATPSADRTITLTSMTVDGSSATVSPATVKASKTKATGVNIEVVMNSSGSYFVYGSEMTSG